MHKDENNAIRYLMKEMDPSEEMEFEKLMREDENLLIEVESLRATNRKLSVLPSKNPPEQVTQTIADELKQIQAQRKRTSGTLTFYLKRAVAAVFLLTGLSGGFYYYFSNPSMPAEVQSVTTESSDQVEPWVDRNEILRFEDGASAIQTQDVQRDINRSQNRLQLVNDPSSSNSASGILLTGSPN
ncbi:MAG: hypothetical protein CL666_05970 [Balneola sp.]|nr:hypothetical protein [Balneola sp.]|tara:strand:- start:122819 stop:123373 length:555 start_codon:yes stop_codon:yes gene_type:complete